MLSAAKLLRRYAVELVLLAAFVTLCAIFDGFVNSHLDVDSYRYLELGTWLLQEQSFGYFASGGSYTPDYIRTPTYPVLIACALAAGGKTGTGILLTVWLQRLAWGLAVAFILPKARSAAGGVRRWTLLGKAVLLFSPVVLYHSSVLLTDLLYAAGVFVVLKISIGARHGNFFTPVLAGLFHGLMTLLRPVHLLVPLLIALPTVRRRPSIAAIFIVSGLLLPTAWILRNHSIHGRYSIAALSGRALALHQEPALRKMHPAASKTPYGPEFIAALHSTTENPITAAWILMRDYGIPEVKADEVAKRVAWESVFLYPYDYFFQTAKNLGRFFWSPVDGYNVAAIFLPAVSPNVHAAFGYGFAVLSIIVFLLLPLLLLVKYVPRRFFAAPIFVQAGLITGYFLFVPALTTVTYGRFLLPLLPVIGFIYCMADYGRAERTFTGISKRKTDGKKF